MESNKYQPTVTKSLKRTLTNQGGIKNMPPRVYGSYKPNVSNKTHQGALIMLPSITKRAYKNYPLGHSGSKFMNSKVQVKTWEKGEGRGGGLMMGGIIIKGRHCCAIAPVNTNS